MLRKLFSSLQAKSHPSLTIPNWGGGIIKVNVNVDIEAKIVASLPFSASQSKDYYSFGGGVRFQFKR